MASKFAVADSNFTTGSTWATGATGTGCEAFYPTDNQIYGDWIDTASVRWSQAFTVTNNEVIDAVAVCLYKGENPSSGTVTCYLSDDGGVTETRSKTLNVSDLFASSVPADSVHGHEWVVFVFDSTLTADGGSDYKIGLKCSVSWKVAAWRTHNTSYDWLRCLRTTTTGTAPTTDDNLIVAANNGSGTRTVTMNETATTKYGHLIIGKGGIVNYVTNATSNLRIGGRLIVGAGGAMRIGTTGTPVDRSYTATLEFDHSVDSYYFPSMHVSGEFTAQGQSRTSGKNVTSCLLSADASNGATSLTVDTDTGWKSGDTVVIAATANDWTKIHSTTLNGDAGASTLTLTSGLNEARSGTSPKQAEIIVMDRNVIVQSVSSTYRADCYLARAATIDLDWVRFNKLGRQGQIAINSLTDATNGGANFDYCAFDVTNTTNNVYLQASGYYFATKFRLRKSVFGNTSWGSITANHFFVLSWPDDAIVTDNVVVARGNGYGYYVDNLTNVSTSSVTFTGNRVANNTSGIYYIVGQNWAVVTLENNVSHTNINQGLVLAGGGPNVTVKGHIVYCIATYNPLYINASMVNYNWTFENCKFMGASNSTGAANLVGDGIFSKFRFINCEFKTDTSATTLYGMILQNNIVADILFERCAFNTTTSDFYTANGTKREFYLRSRGSTHTSTILTTGSGTNYGSIAIDTGDTHKRWTPEGWTEYETGTYKTAAPSAKLTPASATSKLKVIARYKIAASGTVTPSVYVRKNSSYNGNAPRLIALACPQLGSNFNTDTTLDTFSSGADTWEQLTATTSSATYDGVLEVAVDCDGTAGAIFVDDWA